MQLFDVVGLVVGVEGVCDVDTDYMLVFELAFIEIHVVTMHIVHVDHFCVLTVCHLSILYLCAYEGMMFPMLPLQF